MTAPRTCRACGAELTGDVMWCVRCYEPVRQLTPRAPGLGVSSPAMIRGDLRPRSRWKAGATTFGPAGRIAVTALVVSFAPWPQVTSPIGLAVLWPLYLLIAGTLLRSTWKRDLVESKLPAPSTEDVDRPEPVRPPIPRSTIWTWVGIGVLSLVAAVVWAATGDRAHGIIGILASIGLLVLAMRWFMAG